MSDETNELEQKYTVAMAALNNGRQFQIQLDPRVDGVIVPARFRIQPHLALWFGLDAPIPIPDFHVDRHGVSGTLSFAGCKFKCEIPWRAVFCIMGEGIESAWIESMPPEVKERIAVEATRQKATAVQPRPEPILEPKSAEKPRGTRHLWLVKGGKA